MTLRRLRREWRRLSPLQRLGIVAAVVVALIALGHKATTPASAGTTSSATGNVALGQQMAAADGWTGDQWTCLDLLWQQESSWSNTADNSQSGAYGIPQALPPSKLPPAALPPGNSASAQIGWGLDYIKSAYGNPCNAWSHEEADGWY